MLLLTLTILALHGRATFQLGRTLRQWSRLFIPLPSHALIVSFFRFRCACATAVPFRRAIRNTSAARIPGHVPGVASPRAAGSGSFSPERFFRCCSAAFAAAAASASAPAACGRWTCAADQRLDWSRSAGRRTQRSSATAALTQNRLPIP